MASATPTTEDFGNTTSSWLKLASMTYTKPRLQLFVGRAFSVTCDVICRSSERSAGCNTSDSPRAASSPSLGSWAGSTQTRGGASCPRGKSTRAITICLTRGATRISRVVLTSHESESFSSISGSVFPLCLHCRTSRVLWPIQQDLCLLRPSLWENTVSAARAAVPCDSQCSLFGWSWPTFSALFKQNFPFSKSRRASIFNKNLCLKWRRPLWLPCTRKSHVYTFPHLW